jgi:hypothetical protein
MALEQLALLAEIIAAIAVVASLVYVAKQMRQTNILIGAQAVSAEYEGRRNFAENLSLTPSLAEVLAKVKKGEKMSEAESIQLYALGLSVLRSFEYHFLERASGAHSRDEHYVDRLRALYHSNWLDYRLADTWNKSKSQFNPEFARFFEENVVTRPVG